MNATESIEEEDDYSRRYSQEDYPLLVFYSLVGNDVCNGHTNQTGPMTPPEKFKERVRVNRGVDRGGWWCGCKTNEACNVLA